MATVRVTEAAADDLRRMLRTHSLPANTGKRVARSLAVLEEFPRIGPALSGPWDGYRFLLGPWSWMVLVYEILSEDVIAVVTIQDARGSGAATGSR